MTIRILLILLSLFTIMPVTMAEGVVDEVADSMRLDQVVVTGTRTRKLLKDTPIQTRIITTEDIVKSDATNIMDLLQHELPGVEFAYAMNQQTNMNMSGFSGQGILILLDGERMAGETMENTDFMRLNMADVDHIEIIKGAASALYGSNAVGGVINIITKESQQPWSLNVNARWADHKEQRYGSVFGLNKGRFNNVASLQHTYIDTYTVCADMNDDCEFRKVYGRKTWNIKDRLVWRPLDNMKLIGHIGYFFRQDKQDPVIPDRYRDFSGGLRGEWNISSRDYLEMVYNFDQYDKSDYYKEYNKDIRDYSNVQNSVRALYNHTFGKNGILTFGGDYMRDYLLSYQFDAGRSYHQYTTDLFAQYDWTINNHWELIGAGRWDYFSDKSTSHITGKLGFRYNLNNFTLRGGYASGFRAPTLKEKYSQFLMVGTIYVYGNENLTAEKSHNFNLGAEYTVGQYNFTVSANYNIVNNKIATHLPQVDVERQRNYIQYINIKRMNVFALEATAQSQWQLSDASVIAARLGYCYTHEQVRDGSANQYAPARPHSLIVRADWSKAWTKNYATTLLVTGRYLSPLTYTKMQMAPPFSLYDIDCSGYSIWKVQLTNRIRKAFSLNVALDNIFNYAPRHYLFNSPTTLGINLMVGVSIDIDKL